MTKQKSPHTQSQQNTNFAQTDVNPDDMLQTVGTGEDGASYENRDGAQTGGTRSPRHTPGSSNPPKTQQEKAVRGRKDAQAGINHNGRK